MAEHSTIEWTDATWNIVTGCSVVSPGCTNCYAMKLAGTRLKHHWSRQGLTHDTKAGPVWNGEVRFNDEWLRQPLQWTRPRMIFVCAHADLFHESVPDAWIDQVFAVMALAPQHAFQVLTKRSGRMRAYLSDPGLPLRVGALLMDAARGNLGMECAVIDITHALTMKGFLPNVWLGVSVEDQARADERIPDLLATPAAIRWISAEPLLGDIDLANPYTYALFDQKAHERGIKLRTPWQDRSGGWRDADDGCDLLPGLDWVVAGGESGPDARPMHEDWARSLRDQCVAAGVSFHFKQWGEWFPMGQTLPDGCISCLDRHEEPGLWDEATMSARLGKKRTGRLLDGREWNEMPERVGP